LDEDVHLFDWQNYLIGEFVCAALRRPVARIHFGQHHRVRHGFFSCDYRATDNVGIIKMVVLGRLVDLDGSFRV
jgi:hypothetical protein